MPKEEIRKAYLPTIAAILRIASKKKSVVFE
jgi:hypothetical protein